MSDEQKNRGRKKKCIECGATKSLPNTKRKNGGPWRIGPITNEYPLCLKCWNRQDRQNDPQKYYDQHQIYYEKKKPQIRANIKRWSIKNAKKISMQQHKKRIENKEKLFLHFSKGKPKCACCSVKGTDFLTVDHIIPRKKMGKNKKLKKILFNEKWKTDQIVRWLLKNLDNNKFILRYFQILCFNCNRGKFFEGICPHKIKSYWQTILLAS